MAHVVIYNCFGMTVVEPAVGMMDSSMEVRTRFQCRVVRTMVRYDRPLVFCHTVPRVDDWLRRPQKGLPRLPLRVEHEGVLEGLPRGFSKRLLLQE